MKKALCWLLLAGILLFLTSCGIGEEIVRETMGDEMAEQYRVQNEVAINQLKESTEELGEIIKEEVGEELQDAAEELYPGKMTAAQLQEKFPHGRYWNRVGLGVDNNQDGTTGTPCPDNHSSSTTCNKFAPTGYKLSTQCMGFAEKLGYDFTGINPRDGLIPGESEKPVLTWYTADDALEIEAALLVLKPGDIVRYTMYYDNPATPNNEHTDHSIFVLKVEEGKVTYADCNGIGKGHRCEIRWGATITKEKMREKGLVHVRVAPYPIQE